jgi:hypothetical protein
MEVAAHVGYRVIGLEYDNATSVPQTCGKNPDPDCSDEFREKHSQGGGMGPFIAKKYKVARVIILSGAWDRVEATKEFAPWITAPSATPLDRWYAAYHQKESRAAAMKAAYAMLKIPPSHVRVMTLDPRPGPGMNPRADLYHGSMDSPRLTPVDADGNPAYTADWEFLLGSPRQNRPRNWNPEALSSLYE